MFIYFKKLDLPKSVYIPHIGITNEDKKAFGWFGLFCLVVGMSFYAGLKIGHPNNVVTLVATPSQTSTPVQNDPDLDEFLQQVAEDNKRMSSEANGDWTVGNFGINETWVNLSDDEAWTLKSERQDKEQGVDGSKQWKDFGSESDYNEYQRDLYGAHHYYEYWGPIDGMRQYQIDKAYVSEKLLQCVKMYKNGWFLESLFLLEELHTTGIGMDDNAERSKFYYLEYLIKKALVEYTDSCDKEWGMSCASEEKSSADMFCIWGEDKKNALPFATYLDFVKVVDKIVPLPGKYLEKNQLRWHGSDPEVYRQMYKRAYAHHSKEGDDSSTDCETILKSDSSCRATLRMYKHPEEVYQLLRAPK